jgi:hypothetical protein
MSITPEALNEIDKYAKLQFSKNEIGLITGQNIETQEVDLAIQKGYLVSEAEIRQQIFDLANSGSAPSLLEAIKLIERRKRK